MLRPPKWPLLASLCFFSCVLRADDVVINFDDLPESSMPQGYYHNSKGVDFLTTDRTGTAVTLPSVRRDPNARSSPNVASIRTAGCVGEFCANRIVGQFTSP